MYVIGRDTSLDRVRRIAERLSLREKRDYFYKNKNWLAYYATCYELGELSEKECLTLKKKVLTGEIK